MREQTRLRVCLHGAFPEPNVCELSHSKCSVVTSSVSYCVLCPLTEVLCCCRWGDEARGLWCGHPRSTHRRGEVRGLCCRARRQVTVIVSLWPSRSLFVLSLIALLGISPFSPYSGVKRCLVIRTCKECCCPFMFHIGFESAISTNGFLMFLEVYYVQLYRGASACAHALDLHRS